MLHIIGVSLVAQMVKSLFVMQGMWVQPLGREDPLEKKMPTRSSIFAWKIQWMGEPFGVQFIGSLAGYSPWNHKDK